MKNLRIVFMGTPDFAVGILDRVIAEGWNVVAVVTAADKPAGRGQQLRYSAVKQYATEKELPVLQPTNLKDTEFLNTLRAFEADVHIVVAFRMLPEAVWRMPAGGTFNLHASLLPEYRGAAPINWAIINGEKMSGVTTFFIDDKIDTGAIILQRECGIGPNETAGMLHDRLMELGAGAVVETLDLIQIGQAKPVPQDPSGATKTAHKLHRENCKIDFSKSASEVHNLVRGLSPYPAAWCTFVDGERAMDVKIFEVQPEVEHHDLAPGTMLWGKKDIRIACSGGFVRVMVLQLAGKKKMTAQEVCNGVSLSEQASAR